MALRLIGYCETVRRVAIIAVTCASVYVLSYYLLTRGYSPSITIRDQSRGYIVFIFLKGHGGVQEGLGSKPIGGEWNAAAEQLLGVVFRPLLLMECRLGTRYYEPLLKRTSTGELVCPER